MPNDISFLKVYINIYFERNNKFQSDFAFLEIQPWISSTLLVLKKKKKNSPSLLEVISIVEAIGIYDLDKNISSNEKKKKKKKKSIISTFNSKMGY